MNTLNTTQFTVTTGRLRLEILIQRNTTGSTDSYVLHVPVIEYVT